MIYYWISKSYRIVIARRVFCSACPGMLETGAAISVVLFYLKPDLLREVYPEEHRGLQGQLKDFFADLLEF